MGVLVRVTKNFSVAKPHKYKRVRHSQLRAVKNTIDENARGLLF